MNNQEEVAVSCKLTTPELQQRKRTVILDLQKHQLEKQELAVVYVFRYAGSEEIVDLVTVFIKTERLCCDFFNFHMAVNNDSSLWLTLTGPEGTKGFIAAELSM